MSVVPPSSQPAMIGVTAIKPVERHGWEAYKFFFWDPSRKAVMGRTGKSWALIITFYIIYYSCLAAFWSLIFYIFWLTLDMDQPKWKKDDGLIGTSPGLGLRPSQPDSHLDSSMIIFNKDSKKGTEDVPGTDLWRISIHEFLAGHYSTDAYKSNDIKAVNCTTNGKASDDQACKFPLGMLGPCGDERTAYGYASGTPCIYLKLNRIFGLEHDNFQEGTEEMPADLVTHIGRQKNKDQTWVSCVGENPADMEALGPITYWPRSRGFSSHYFPYLGQESYQSPLVAVQFNKPKVGQLLHIECRAWARNVKYNRAKRSGMVHLELFILDNQVAGEYRKSQE